MKKLEIISYLSLACSSEDELRSNIDQALEAENISADVSLQRINDQKAAALALGGSPSVFINGEELQPTGIPGFS